MASVASKLMEGVTVHAQSNSLEDARKICANGTYFPNNYVYRYMLCGGVAACSLMIVVDQNM